MKWTETRALLGTVIVVTACVVQVFQNGLVYDDAPVIKGPLIHHPERLSEEFRSHAMLAQGVTDVSSLDTYRPVTIASFFWDAWLSGEEPWSYHLTNLLLHLACVALVFLLARELLPTAGLRIWSFAALFFGLSPQLAEGYVWINGRSDPLATLFGLASILIWRRALGGQAGKARLFHGLAGMAFLLGLLCKEVLLLATPALFFWPEDQPVPLLARIRRTLPFSISSLVYLGLRIHVLQGIKASAWPSHASGAMWNLPILWADGLTELLAPTHLYLRSMRDEYAALTSTQRALLLALTVVLSVVCVVVRKRAPVFVWSLGWYALTLAPAVMIASLVWPGFGRYLYVPCAVLAIGLAELLALLASALHSLAKPWLERLVIASLALYLAALGAYLAGVTRDYQSNQTLYGAIVLSAPELPHGYGFLGISRLDAGFPAEAIPLLERALLLGGFEPRYQRSLIRAKMHLGDIATAETLARDAVQRTAQDPRIAGEMRSLLMKALALKSPVEAMAVLCECLALDPSSIPCLRAPAWMLDPSVQTHETFRSEFLLFEKRCRSDAAVTAFKRVALPLLQAGKAR